MLFSRLRIQKVLCLLFTVGIFFICTPLQARASEYIDSNLTGTTDTSTAINDAGTAESADELAELNIANTVTITYDDGNGTIP